MYNIQIKGRCHGTNQATYIKIVLIDSGYHKVSFEKQITFTEGAHILDICIRLKTDFIFNKHLS